MLDFYLDAANYYIDAEIRLARWLSRIFMSPDDEDDDEIEEVILDYTNDEQLEQLLLSPPSSCYDGDWDDSCSISSSL
mgnify:CR=1 FL=1